MSDDERVTNIILDRLKTIEDMVRSMQANGCNRAYTHQQMQENEAELFRRMNDVEKVQAEGRGKLVIIVAFISAASGVFFAWIGKHLT